MCLIVLYFNGLNYQPLTFLGEAEMIWLIRVISFPEPDSKELQEAVSKDTFQHEFNNLEPATTYSIYLKAYSPLGASQKSNTVIATTLGGGKWSHITLLPHHSSLDDHAGLHEMYQLPATKPSE